MLLWTTLKIALSSLAMNKLRSILTMLGVIIGVGAVIAMLSLGNAFGQYIRTQVGKTGTDVLYIRAGQFQHGPMSLVQTLTPDDASAILEHTSAKAVTPLVAGNAGTVKAGNKSSATTTVMGVAPSLTQISNIEIQDGGRMFTDDELRRQARVAVIGPKTSRDLFGDLDPVGRTIRIADLPFRIIGQTVELGGQMGQDPDDRVLVPFTTAMTQIPPRRDYIQVAIVGAYNESQLTALTDEIKQLLRRRHHLAADQQDDFSIMNVAEAMRTLSAVTMGLTLFLGTVASISLVVGGIGIMNIMLATVAERTREIGIRKAIGAKDRDILRQFLIEALVITLGGGLLGLLLGWGVMSLTIVVVSKFLALSAQLQWWVVAMAIGISTFVGLVSGLYPAFRASRLDPVEALRYE